MTRAVSSLTIVGPLPPELERPPVWL
jgi:hypothetical protein